jgi:predicted DNA-binding transcriptional regulator AlpA
MSRRLIAPEALPNYGVPIGNKQRKRLEAAGKFPKRVPLTERRHAYVEDEILAYGEARIRLRDGKAETMS